MKNKYLLFLIALLFSIPDARLLGFTTQTIILGLCIIFSIIYFNSAIQKKVLIFNSPFIFLLLLSTTVWIFTLLSYTNEDISYIFSKIRELFTDLILVYLIYIVFKDKIKFIKHFIELFFIFNITYYLVKNLNSSIAFFFHQSIDKVYSKESFFLGREFFLGWEPSYIVPVSVMLCLIYLTIYTNKINAILITISTVFIFFMSLSKTAFIMIFVLIFMNLYFYLNKKIINKNFLKFVIFMIFLLSTIAVLIYLENQYHIFTFHSTKKSEQYELISFLTRSKLMIESINQFILFPYGYGYGNSIIILSNYIDNNIMSFLTSYEIVESSKYARSPKSQLFEYILSGGLIFILLFVFFHMKYLINQLSMIDIKTKQNLIIITTILFITILFGERIPYLLTINFIFMITTQKLEQGNT